MGRLSSARGTHDGPWRLLGDGHDVLAHLGDKLGADVVQPVVLAGVLGGLRQYPVLIVGLVRRPPMLYERSRNECDVARRRRRGHSFAGIRASRGQLVAVVRRDRFGQRGAVVPATAMPRLQKSRRACGRGRPVIRDLPPG